MIANLAADAEFRLIKFHGRGSNVGLEFRYANSGYRGAVLLPKSRLC